MPSGGMSSALSTRVRPSSSQIAGTVAAISSANAMSKSPSVAESGYPGFDAGVWYALLAPARTPPEIVKWLETETLKVLAQPDMKEKLFNAGFQIRPRGADAVWARVNKEIAQFREVIEKAGIEKL